MLDRQVVQKRNTKSSAQVSIDLLKDEDIYKVLSEISYIGDNNDFKLLVSKFEQQLLLSMVDKDKFINELHKFYKDNERFIKKHKLQKEFIQFTLYIKTKLKLQKTNKNIFAAYISLLMQQASYLKSQFKMICGIHSNGSFIERPESYKYFEYPSIELEIDRNKKPSFKDYEKALKKYGYGYIKTVEDFLTESANEVLVSNMFFDISALIDENTEDMIPLPFFKPANGINTNIHLLNSIKKYKELLSERVNMLPSEGIIAKIYYGDFREVLFKEIYKYGKFYMLFKIKMNDNTYTSGFYDIENQLTYSVFRDIEQEQGKVCHNIVEHLVLGLYAQLTTNSEGIDTFDEVEDINNIDGPFKVEFVYNTPLNKDNNKVQFRKFDKSKLTQMNKQINPFIRRLPEGAKASQEAIDNAKRFGFKLKDGETFVKPFEKTVNINKK